ncbi:MAG: transcription elongation factor GreA [Candidatus Omnitrophota bacterium]|jgi:transcription elongation factor GreA
MSDAVVVTQAGYQKMFDELTHLKTKKRREVAEQLEVARAHGDLRENAEYDSAKQAKQSLETRIAELESRLARAKIVDTSQLPHDKAYLGATVEIKNLESQEVFKYTLVAQDEADFEQGKIPVTAPIGRGLLGKGLGETVEIQVPAGKLKLQIMGIRYD